MRDQSPKINAGKYSRIGVIRPPAESKTELMEVWTRGSTSARSRGRKVWSTEQQQSPKINQMPTSEPAFVAKKELNSLGPQSCFAKEKTFLKNSGIDFNDENVPDEYRLQKTVFDISDYKEIVSAVQQASKQHFMSKPFENLTRTTTAGKFDLKDKTENSNVPKHEEQQSLETTEKDHHRHSQSGKASGHRHNRHKEKSPRSHKSSHGARKSRHKHHARENIENGLEKSQEKEKNSDTKSLCNDFRGCASNVATLKNPAQHILSKGKEDVQIENKPREMLDQENRGSGLGVLSMQKSLVGTDALTQKLKSNNPKYDSIDVPQITREKRNMPHQGNKEPHQDQVPKSVKRVITESPLQIGKHLNTGEPDEYEFISLSKSLANILQAKESGCAPQTGHEGSFEQGAQVEENQSPKSHTCSSPKNNEKVHRHPYTLSDSDDSDGAGYSPLMQNPLGTRPRSGKLNKTARQSNGAQSMLSEETQRVLKIAGQREPESVASRLRRSLRGLKKLSPKITSDKSTSVHGDISVTSDESGRFYEAKQCSIPSTLLRRALRQNLYPHEVNSDKEVPQNFSRTLRSVSKDRRNVSVPRVGRSRSVKMPTRREEQKERLLEHSACSDEEVDSVSHLLHFNLIHHIKNRARENVVERAVIDNEPKTLVRRHSQHFGPSDHLERLEYQSLVSSRSDYSNPSLDASHARHSRKPRSTSRGRTNDLLRQRENYPPQKTASADALSLADSCNQTSKATTMKEIFLSVRPAKRESPTQFFSPQRLDVSGESKLDTIRNLQKGCGREDRALKEALGWSADDFDKLFPLCDDPHFDDKVNSIKHWLETTKASPMKRGDKDAQVMENVIGFKPGHPGISLAPTVMTAAARCNSDAPTAQNHGDGSLGVPRPRKRPTPTMNNFSDTGLPPNRENDAVGSTPNAPAGTPCWPVSDLKTVKPGLLTNTTMAVSVKDRSSPKKVAELAAAGHKAFQRRAGQSTPGFRTRANAARRGRYCVRCLLYMCVILVTIELLAVGVAFIWHGQAWPSVIIHKCTELASNGQAYPEDRSNDTLSLSSAGVTPDAHNDGPAVDQTLEINEVPPVDDQGHAEF